MKGKIVQIIGSVVDVEFSEASGRQTSAELSAGITNQIIEITAGAESLS